MASATTADLEPDDPYARGAQTFPLLTDHMLERLHEYAQEESLEPGQLIFHRGDRKVDFFVVLEGAVEVVAVQAIHQHLAAQS